ncbi:HNH endonuclease [Actinomadura sp. KC06]|uniref:HNH endonuclease signature motif containing protein n=1 Tax=Actinomadura sp. KC06 TaxID=2530369 RepID=UPI00104476C5|nr:HNH endonuclease signature motif containing protein [Actinomadura sp. KC06]TDD27863.1 HNH endonuclease [Actinomadura sp. KC06]
MGSVEVDLARASTAELVNAAAAIARELAARTAPESAAACMELAETLAAACDQQESALAELIGRVDASGEMRRWGLPSTQAWLRSHMGMRDSRAKERLTLARQRHRLPRITQLLATGDLTYGYATTVTDAVARLDDDDCTQAETVLLDMIDQGFSPGKVASFGRRIRDVIAERDGTDTPDKDSQRGYDSSWITSTRSLDGGRYVKGWLNAEDAAVWDGTLAPLAKPAGPDDRRDLPERTAAALTGVLAGGHRATKVTVICDLDTLTSGSTAPGRLTDGTPIPAAHVRRIALSAGVSALILGRGHVPLYLGHRARFATPGQRQVLETLYPTCAVQGCEVPGTLCEVDHVTGWALGSPTDIDKLALCCGWHNRFKHTNAEQINIVRDATGRFIYRVLPPPDAIGPPTELVQAA